MQECKYTLRTRFWESLQANSGEEQYGIYAYPCKVLGGDPPLIKTKKKSQNFLIIISGQNCFFFVPTVANYLKPSV